MANFIGSNTTPQHGGPSFPLRHRIFRALWSFMWAAFASWTPVAFHPWRRALLRLFGANMGTRSDVRASARIWYPPNLVMERDALIAGGVKCYNMAPIRIGRGALVSQGAFLCAGTHDYNDPHFTLIRKPISLGPLSWIAAEAFVGPGVTVGEGAVLGARAVARRAIEPWTVNVGNPAVVVADRRSPEKDTIAPERCGQSVHPKDPRSEHPKFL